MPKNINTIFLGLKIGLVIALPLVGFLLLGLWIDSKLNTFPLYLIIGMISGIAGGAFVVYKIIIPYVDKKVKDNNNKNNK